MTNVVTREREFPTPVILDQARERAALNGKFCDRFSDEDSVLPYPFVLRGTVEESEILNLSPVAEGFGVSSGRACLHGFKRRNADLNTLPPDPKAIRFVICRPNHDEVDGIVGSDGDARRIRR